MGALGGDDRVHVHGAALAAAHLVGMGVFAFLYGLVRAVLAVRGRRGDLRPVAAGRELRRRAVVVLAIASMSFLGIGMMSAVLPLISPEKGAQLGFVAQGIMLVVSGVYYPVDVLPQWMQWLAAISPATYALARAATRSSTATA